MHITIPLHNRWYLLNSLRPSDAYMHQWIGWALVQIIVCRLFGAKQQFCLGLSVLTLNALNCFEEESINIIIINHVAMENHSKVFIGIVK